MEIKVDNRRRKWSQPASAWQYCTHSFTM